MVQSFFSDKRRIDQSSDSCQICHDAFYRVKSHSCFHPGNPLSLGVGLSGCFVKRCFCLLFLLIRSPQYGQVVRYGVEPVIFFSLSKSDRLISRKSYSPLFHAEFSALLVESFRDCPNVAEYAGRNRQPFQDSSFRLDFPVQVF